MLAARGADALAVAVTTRAHDEQALRAAGADVVLRSLTEFATWYEEYDQYDESDPNDSSGRQGL